jgi:hypothetical protein
MMALKIFIYLFIIASLSACAKKSNIEHLVPENLAGMELQQTFVNKEAEKIVNQLHGKFVSGTENIVAYYNNDDSKGELYISTFKDTLKALEIFHKMMRGVRQDTSVFTHFTPRIIGEQAVVMVIGVGQIHYFFTKGREVYWLQIDQPKAELAISDLIDSR